MKSELNHREPRYFTGKELLSKKLPNSRKHIILEILATKTEVEKAIKSIVGNDLEKYYLICTDFMNRIDNIDIDRYKDCPINEIPLKENFSPSNLSIREINLAFAYLQTEWAISAVLNGETNVALGCLKEACMCLGRDDSNDLYSHMKKAYGRVAAQKGHQTRNLYTEKNMAIEYYKTHKNEFKSMKKAADHITKQLQIHFDNRTVYDWIREYEMSLKKKNS